MSELISVIAIFCAGVMTGLLSIKTRVDFVRDHTKEPYCQTAELGDKEVKRCWIAKEVEP